VFARKGYHQARVGDIAEEAGVAHGLLYHYFPSEDGAREQLRQVAAILLRAWRRDADLVRVLVREVTRSAEVGKRVGEIGDAFAAIERIVRRGQADGSFREDLDARLASVIFYGALEEVLTGWVLGLLPDGDEEVARAEETVVEIVAGGLGAALATDRN
jgi:TetR/AcrR family fatty acid metabolism transcriptional regulator